LNLIITHTGMNGWGGGEVIRVNHLITHQLLEWTRLIFDDSSFLDCEIYDFLDGVVAREYNCGLF